MLRQGWAGGLWGLWFCHFIEFFSGEGATQQPLCTQPCQCVIGQPWVYHETLNGQVQPLHCEADVVEPALGAAAGLGRWFVGVAVLPLPGVFQLKRRCSATTEHSALLVCEWPGLGIPWGTV